VDFDKGSDIEDSLVTVTPPLQGGVVNGRESAKT